MEADGSVVVTFRTASIDWLVRHVLRFGDQAVVIAPDAVSRGGEAGGGGRQS